MGEKLGSVCDDQGILIAWNNYYNTNNNLQAEWEFYPFFTPEKKFMVSIKNNGGQKLLYGKMGVLPLFVITSLPVFNIRRTLGKPLGSWKGVEFTSRIRCYLRLYSAHLRLPSGGCILRSLVDHTGGRHTTRGNYLASGTRLQSWLQAKITENNLDNFTCVVPLANNGTGNEECCQTYQYESMLFNETVVSEWDLVCDRAYINRYHVKTYSVTFFHKSCFCNLL